TPLTYAWDFGDESPLSVAVSPSHTYTAPGTYIATLTVTDGGGAVHTAAADAVTVVANQPPVANGTAAPDSGKEPLTVAFTATGTTDPDDDLGDLAYSWDFGDGSPASTTGTTSHTYASAVGSPFTATLTVTDPFGGVDT